MLALVHHEFNLATAAMFGSLVKVVINFFKVGVEIGSNEAVVGNTL